MKTSQAVKIYKDVTKAEVRIELLKKMNELGIGTNKVEKFIVEMENDKDLKGDTREIKQMIRGCRNSNQGEGDRKLLRLKLRQRLRRKQEEGQS